MSSICIDIDDMINKYLKKELSVMDKLQLYNHISECQSCREEFVFIVKLHKVLNERVKEVPKEIKKCAYLKVREELTIKKLNNISTDLVNIIKIPTPNFPLKVLTYLLENVKNVVYLSFNNI